MAKDLDDRSTLDLLPAPKRRGRPPTGKALSNAERQRKFRSEKIVTVTINREDMETLMTLVNNPDPALLPKIDLEAIERVKERLGIAMVRQIDKHGS